MNKALALNETHAVLFGKDHSNNTENDESSKNTDATFNTTADVTVKRSALFEETSFEESALKVTELSVTYGGEKSLNCSIEKTGRKRGGKPMMANKKPAKDQPTSSKEIKLDINSTQDEKLPDIDGDMQHQKAIHHSMVFTSTLNKSNIGTPLRARRNPRRRSTAN